MATKYQGPPDWLYGDSTVVNYSYQPIFTLVSERLCDVPATTLTPEASALYWWGLCPSCRVYYGGHTTDCPEVGSEARVGTNGTPPLVDPKTPSG